MLLNDGGKGMSPLDTAPLGGPIDRAGDDGVVDVVRNGEVTRIFLGGDVDVETARRLGPFLEAEGDGHTRTIVVDLSAVEFVDSYGLRLLVDMHRRLLREGRSLVLVRPPDHVWRVFVLTGLDGVLVVQSDA